MFYLFHSERVNKSNVHRTNYTGLNSLPNDKISDFYKLEAIADNKRNVTQKLKFAVERVENIAGEGENAGYQHFLLFPECFPKTLWEKEKMLVTSIFSFFHIVFKRLLPQAR